MKVYIISGIKSQINYIMILLLLSSNSFATPCVGSFINPITDICWSCMFPISIGNVRVTGNKGDDIENPDSPICVCPKIGVPTPGITMGFWEPVRLIEVTRTPYCMVNLNGLQMGSSSIIGHGAIGEHSDSGDQDSFYQAHYYIYPLIYWLELLTDFACGETLSFDLGYITELDPTWNNDEWSAIINPEAFLFSNTITQALCAADCAKATVSYPLDCMFWCAGCQGAIYPFTGHVAFHQGGVESSSLIAQRLLAKLHRLMLADRTSTDDVSETCDKHKCPIIKKSQYRTQMTYPIPATSRSTGCNALGKTSVIWGAGREYPYKGEDFGYLIWRKRNCCLL